MKRKGTRAIVWIALVLASRCATRPRATPEAIRRAGTPPAIVEGRVLDREGRPAAGVTVWGLPREKDVGWSLPSVTDAAGRFRLTLVAPGEYGFLVSWKGITVVTPRKDDPSRVLVSLSPRENRTGIELVFRRDEWDRALLSRRAP